MNHLSSAAIILSAALLATQAAAAPVTFTATGTSGTQALAARADFSVVSGNLQVVLTNLGSDVLNGNGVLTALFFDIASDPTLSRVSAALSPGSTPLFGGTDLDGGVGGEWSYRTGLAGAPGGALQGISSAALGGLFNAGNRFPGTDLGGGNNVNGLQYGITSGLDDGATGNAAVTGNNALIQNSVTFVLGNVPGGFDPVDDISNVRFQYGLALTAPSLAGQIPEPSGAALLSFALGALGALRRRCISVHPGTRVAS